MMRIPRLAFVAALAMLTSVSGFEFRHHAVDVNLPGTAWGQTALVDLDRDGDLDFITGQRGGDIRWYAFERPSKRWTMHVLGILSQQMIRPNPGRNAESGFPCTLASLLAI